MFDTTVGKVFGFYGVCDNQFRLGTVTYEAVEDPDDGYRSYMSSIEVRETSGVFFDRPLAYVRVEADAEIEGYSLVDVSDGHVWLRFGTDDWDDYYPCFCFNYFPKK